MSDCLPQRQAHVVHDWRPASHDNYSVPLIREEPGRALVIGRDRRPQWLWQLETYYATNQWEATLMGEEPPRVLLCYVHRPLCVGQHIAAGFRLAGCRVRTAGPQAPYSWGRPAPRAMWEPPSFELPDQAIEIDTVVEIAEAGGFRPQLVVMVDQYDQFYLVGNSTSQARFAWIAVENWDVQQAARGAQRRADLELYCVNHWEEGGHTEGVSWTRRKEGTPPPLMNGAQRLLFAVDTTQRFVIPDVVRDKWVVQIGVAYEPRPQVWNHLRWALDGKLPLSPDEFNSALGWQETAHTLFGWARSHRLMNEAYNRALSVLSSANQDYVPNRVPDAFATGAILIADDVPSLTEAWGPPLTEEYPEGIWLAHDRTLGGIEAQVRRVVDMTDEERAVLRTRAYVRVMTGHTYAHRARSILKAFNLEAACRLVAE